MPPCFQGFPGAAPRLVSMLLSLTLVSSPLFSQATGTPDVTFRGSAQEVSLTFVVRNAKGKVVRNLTPDEIEIFEDGVKRDIKSFHYIAGKDALKAADPTRPGSVPSVAPTAVPASNLVCIVYEGLDANTKRNAVSFTRDFLQSQVAPGTWIASFNLGDQLTPLHEFTTNRQELLKAATDASLNPTVDFASVANEVISATPNIISVNAPTGPGSSTSGGLTVTGGEVNTSAVNNADVSTGDGANRARGELVNQRRQFSNVQGQRTLDMLRLLVRQFGTLPGHKSVVLFTTGMVGPTDLDRFQEVIHEANKARLTFYAVDVNGLTENSNLVASKAAMNHVASVSAGQQAGVSSGNAQGALEDMRQGDYLEQALRQTDPDAPVRAIAEGTGGFLVANTNDMRKSFQHLAEDLDSHYEAIYTSGNPRLDGHLRAIQVKLTHTDWTVDNRAGYYALPSGNGVASLTPGDMSALAALNDKSHPHSFDFGATALAFNPASSGVRDEIAFEVPVSALTARPFPAAKQHQIHVSFLALVKDQNGDIVDTVSKDAGFNIADDALAAAQKNYVNLSKALTLPVGRYSVEVAAVDRESQKSSTATFAFENREVKGLGLSSVALVQRLDPVSGAANTDEPFEVALNKSEAKRIIPQADATITAAAHPYAYFVIYPNKANASKAKLQVEFVLDDKVLARQSSETPAPNQQGQIPMIVGVAAKPGRCEVRITATQGDESTTQILRYTVKGS